MKRKYLVFFAIAALCFSAFSPFFVKMVRGADEGTVGATVTAVIYALTVDNASIAFGSVAQNSTKNTVDVGGETTTIENTGTVAEKLSIKAIDSTGGSGWTLAGTAGSETYTLKTSLGVGSTGPFTAVSTSYADLVANVGVGGTQPFEVEIGTPTSTSETTEQSTTITILAGAL